MSARQLDLFAPGASGASFLVEELRSFTFNGARTAVERRDGVDFLFNEFWTSRQRQAHRLHEVSYRACFKPQLPEFFIARLTREGESVYDPFMGRGTTPVQAALMGRRAVGVDINPLSAVFGKPRLAPPGLGAIATRLKEIDWNCGDEASPDLLAFFHPETLEQIQALRRYLLERETAGSLDAVDEWIRMVAVNRLTGHSPGFLSVYTLPPNQAVSAEAQRKINMKRGQTPPKRDAPGIILKKSRSLLSQGAATNIHRHLMLTGDAASTPEIADGSIDLVVTSPPFLDVVQYAADNWLRCWFIGRDAGAIPIAMHRNPEDWMRFIRLVFMELSRAVRVGGHVAFEVGEVRSATIELETWVLRAIEGLPWSPLCVLVNVQEFTKTAHCWGVANNAKGTNTNRVVILRRRG
ncbi:MAG: DNA methyltransferase [Roseiarcus sp.]